MMNKDEALLYGRKTGCKYYVYNSNDGLMGGFRTRAAAEEYLQECEEEYKNDKLNHDMTFYIKEEVAQMQHNPGFNEERIERDDD